MGLHRRLLDPRTSLARADLKAQIATGAAGRQPLLAFADPEFMSDPALRGIRTQIELMRPEVVQQALGVKHHVAWPTEEGALALLEVARQMYDLARAPLGRAGFTPSRSLRRSRDIDA